MFTYDICNVTDRELFDKSLKKLKGIKEFSLEDKVLEDVDGSLLAIFYYHDSKVILKNDEQIGALYIESEKDIEKLIFN